MLIPWLKISSPLLSALQGKPTSWAVFNHVRKDGCSRRAESGSGSSTPGMAADLISNWFPISHVWFWWEFAFSSFYSIWYFCWCFWCTFGFTRKHAFRAHIKLDNVCKKVSSMAYSHFHHHNKLSSGNSTTRDNFAQIGGFVSRFLLGFLFLIRPCLNGLPIGMLPLDVLVL
ncbi:hypothetical protein ACFX2A_006347 [Malus domestica]